MTPEQAVQLISMANTISWQLVIVSTFLGLIWAQLWVRK